MENGLRPLIDRLLLLIQHLRVLALLQALEDLPRKVSEVKTAGRSCILGFHTSSSAAERVDDIVTAAMANISAWLFQAFARASDDGDGHVTVGTSAAERRLSCARPPPSTSFMEIVSQHNHLLHHRVFSAEVILLDS